MACWISLKSTGFVLCLGLAGLVMAQAPAQPSGSSGAAPASSSPQGPSSASADSAILRASQVIGWDVVNADGQDIAKVEDLVVDVEQGRIAYAVLSVGGFLGVGERLVAYPLPSPKASLQAGRLRLDASKEELKGMRGFEASSWPDFNAPEFAATPTQPTAARVYEGARLRRASEAIKADLRDPEGNDVGDLKDMLIRLEDARVSHVVVDLDPSWYDRAGWVALPINSIRPRGRDFVAAFDPEHIRPVNKEKRAAVPPPPAAPPVPDRDERVTKLIGRRVIDPSGNEIATVRDFVIDTDEQRVAYAVLGVGGVMNVGEKRVAYPLPAREAWMKGDRFVLKASAKDLESRPELKPEKGDSRFVRASRLLKADFVDYTGKDVGDVRDVVVNIASGKVRYAVADFDSSWVQDGKLFAVPFREFRRTEDHPDLVMKVDLNELHGWMIFDEGRWPDLNDPRYRAHVDRYAGR